MEEENQNPNETKKPLSEKTAIACGLEAGIYAVVINWLLLLIPAFALQGIGIRFESPTYVFLLSGFQIVMTFLAPFFANRSVGKNVNLTESSTKAAITSAITTILIVFLIEMVIGTGTIVPFGNGNIIGFIIFAAVNFCSNYVFRNRFLNK